MMFVSAPIAPLSSSELEAALTKDASNISLRIQYARSLFDAKRYTDSIAQYDIILAAKPDDYPDQFNRALAEDMVAYTKAKPDEYAGWRTLATIHSKMNNWKEAEAAYSKSIALDPYDIELYKKRGIAEHHLREDGAAYQDLEKYNEDKPDDDETRKLLAEIRRHTVAELPTNVERREHLRKHPDDFRGWHEIGVVYLSGKQYADAIDALTKAITLKQDAQYLFERGFAYYNLAATDPSAFGKASADADAALVLKSDYPAARMLKADAEFGSKDYEAASRDYTAYLALPGIAANDRAYAQKQLTLARQAITPASH